MSYMHALVLQTILLVATLAELNPDLKAVFAKITPSSNLAWQPCRLSESKYECAVLDVPLDYDAPTGSRARVPLVKFPAGSEATYKGMILYNPGGPGASAIDALIKLASNMSRKTGPEYDLVAWEPRGVGYSNPVARCSNISGTLHDREVATIEKLIQDDDQFLNKWLEEERTLYNSCVGQMGGFFEAGMHMSTGVIAHDILAILDAFAASEATRELQDPGLLNYLGTSYGTFIGQTFASMFPDRVGRVVLDGVVDPYDYVQGNLSSSIMDADATFLTFFLSCFEAGPDLCAYNRNDTSALQIFERFKEMVNRLHGVDLPLSSSASRTNSYGLALIKSMIMDALSRPQDSFPNLAHLFSHLEERVLQQESGPISKDELSLLQDKQSQYFAAEHSSLQQEVWFIGPRCSDINQSFYNRTLEDLEPLVKGPRNTSYVAGFFKTMQVLRCSLWPLKGHGVYLGPFGGDTHTPILFVRNTRDPITSLLRSTNATFSSARHLTVHGIGHTSQRLGNKCADKVIHDYFHEGLLPNDGHHCQEDQGPFGVKTEHLEQSEEWKAMIDTLESWRQQSILGERWKEVY